ncbi:MAG: extracellular solute-binding protein [Acetobacteraceae bacterium]|nr:extracellular solute-binding protein [Acetobacteraceae bacterium]
MLGRRDILKAAAATTLAAPAIAQSRKKIAFLSWNIIDQEQLIRGWIKSFEAANPGVEIEWLDKKGPELPPFYQTQLAAGTPPDVVDIQGALWLEYAANGAIMDLTPQITEVKSRFNPDYLAGWSYQGRNWMVPFYIAKTLLFWNRPLLRKAGLEGAPGSFDGLLEAAEKMASGDSTGLLTLNFDWLYWPLFAMNGVDLLTPDLKKPAFNTPKAVEVVERLAKASESGGVNKISWTGRWVEPNGAFAAGNVGMLHAHSAAYFFIKGQGSWVSPDTLGVGHAPGYWATPTNHGLGVSKGSKNPELAWAFVKHVTDNAQAAQLAENRRILTGNATVDQALLDKLKMEDPLVHAVLLTQVEHTDKLTGNWPLPQDSRVKDAFWPELQSALLGRKPAKQALADAERRVSRELARA